MPVIGPVGIPQAAAAGIAAILAVVAGTLPLDAAIPGLAAATTAASVASALEKFTDAFSEKLGETLGEKGGDALVEQVKKLVGGIEGTPNTATEDETQQVCDNLRTALSVEYLKMLAGTARIPGLQLTATVDHAAARVNDGTDCRQLAELIASIPPTVSATQISTTIQIAFTTAFIEVMAPTAPTPKPTIQVSYTVRPADTLWSIASRQLPASATKQEVARRWMRIWASNPTTICDHPDLIYPGQILLIGG